MRFLSRLRAGLALLQPAEFRIATGTCPFCGPSAFVRLNTEAAGVRCARCAASIVHLSLGSALLTIVPDLSAKDAYEMSARGPLVAHLRARARSLETSEFLDDVGRGEMREGIRCEDVHALAFADASFDVVTHTEVMEHVADDARGFRELRRVLRPGGVMIFTVPLSGHATTRQRARQTDGVIEHLLPPDYHTDPLRGGKSALVYREYGADVTERVKAAGFSGAKIIAPQIDVAWISLNSVVVAEV